MKQRILTLICICACASAFAQWTTGTGTVWTANKVGVGSADANGPRTYLHTFGSRVQNASDLVEEQVFMASRRGIYGTGQQEINLGLFLSKYATATADSYTRAEFRLSNQGSAGNNWGETLLQSNTVMTLLGNGSVGIRNRMPIAQLEVSGSKGSVNDRNFLVNYPPGGSLTNTELSGLAHLQSELGLGWSALYAKQGSAQYAGVFNGNVYMANGSLNIGSSNIGTLKLAVEGTIGAREVIVKTGSWVDYVFADTYKLPSLDEVKSFIKEHHHLPEIPSEQEVVKDGFKVGEMNTLLLKKIEELTLYVIDQNEKIKALESTVNELRSEKKN